jgi:XTP/dITP diphosphohydrolase
MDKKDTIVLATHNAGKIREIEQILQPLGYSCVSVKDVLRDEQEPEETGSTFAENALIKATYYMKRTHMPCLADDSGIVVDALQGRPGVYSARYAGEDCNDERNNEKLIRELAHVPYEQRTSHYACVLVLVWPDGSALTAEGTCEGIIRDTYAGTGGFGYDPLFYLPELGKTMAEVSMAEKNALSHRGKALRKLAGMLK